jgi:hypothetical protein
LQESVLIQSPHHLVTQSITNADSQLALKITRPPFQLFKNQIQYSDVGWKTILTFRYLDMQKKIQHSDILRNTTELNNLAMQDLPITMKHFFDLAK